MGGSVGNRLDSKLVPGKRLTGFGHHPSPLIVDPDKG